MIDFVGLRTALQIVGRPFLDEAREWRKHLVEESKAWRALIEKIALNRKEN